MDGVDNRLERHEVSGRQADTSANDNAVVVCRGQLTFHRLHRHFIWTDEAQVTLPAAVCHLLQRKRNAGAYLLSVHAWRQSKVGVIHQRPRCPPRFIMASRLR